MTRAELREAIEGPASERVLFFEPPSLVDRLLDEVADMPGPLPLLSFVLSEMYRASLRRLLDRTLSDADYQALGGVGEPQPAGRCGVQQLHRRSGSSRLPLPAPAHGGPR